MFDSVWIQLLLAENFNAALQTHHRASTQLTAIDERVQDMMHQSKLQSCFTANPTQLPHTCRSIKWATHFSSSRIDHFLTHALPHQGMTLQSDIVHNVLYDAMYNSSKHSPLQLQLMDPTALLSMGASVMDHEANGAADALPDRVSFSSFSSVAIKEWHACLVSEHTVAIDHVTHLVQSALS